MSGDDITIRGFRLRASYAGFTRTKVFEYERPEDGASISYVWPGVAEGTVYICDDGLSNIPDGAHSDIASKAFVSAAEEIRQWWLTGGRACDVRFIRRTISRISAGFEFLAAEFVIVGEQGPRRSYLYVAGAHGHIVKIRVTLGNDDETSTVAHNFLSSVATHFVTRELTWDTNPERMAELRASIRPIRANIPLCRILEEDFPRDCTGLPIAGGWGYTQRDAVVFVRGPFPLPSLDDYKKLEHHIVQKIIYEELIVSRKTGEGFSGIDAQLRSQHEITESGRTDDCLDFTVSCWSDGHWEFLKTEWEDNDYGHRQGFDRAGHDTKREAARIVFDRQFWFDVTDVLDRSDRKTTRGNVAMTSERRFEVLDLVSLSLPGPWWWHTEDLNDPGATGAMFTCHEEGISGPNRLSGGCRRF